MYFYPRKKSIKKYSNVTYDIKTHIQSQFNQLILWHM